MKQARPNRTLGQNFLINKGIVAKIIHAAALGKMDTVLEIGPGTGALTFSLAREAQKVVAVEKDKTLAEKLAEQAHARNVHTVKIIPGDILKMLADGDFPGAPYTVVANIPYYLTSALIRMLLERKNKPHNIILTIQKEVAQRIVASNEKESILSLSVKFYANAKILFYISKGSFSPIPKVDSACIEITPNATKQKIDPKVFFAVVKAGFSSPRKKLASNLATKLKISKKSIESLFLHMKIEKNCRPETLSLNQWILLAPLLTSPQ